MHITSTTSPQKNNNNMYTNVHLWDEVLEGVHDPWWLGFLVVGEDTSDHHHSSQHNAQVQLQAQNHVVVQYAISQYTPTLHCLTDKGLCCEHTTLLVHEHTSYTHTLSLSLCETLRSNKAITDLVQQFSALAPSHPPPPPNTISSQILSMVASPRGHPFQFNFKPLLMEPFLFSFHANEPLILFYWRPLVPSPPSKQVCYRIHRCINRFGH